MKEVRIIERRGESEPGVRPVAAKKGPPICNRETENHRDVTPTFPLAKTDRKAIIHLTSVESIIDFFQENIFSKTFFSISKHMFTDFIRKNI